jgi:hypothetical protein
MKQLRTQGELAAVLSLPGQTLSKQTIAKVEAGRLRHFKVTWARIESVLGRLTNYVLIGSEAALINEPRIAMLFHDARFRALRRRFGLDPKKGETPPWPKYPTIEDRIRSARLAGPARGGSEMPRRRGRVR